MSPVGALRVGRISALNMYPLYHHLEHRAGAMEFTDGLPATLNAAVIAGRLDVSAMSSIAFARHEKDLVLLPVASVTAAGAVESIQLFSRVPFDEVRSVAVTPASATSVALLRVLLGPDVPFRLLQDDPARELASVDGVLLIGDEALQGLLRGLAPITTDLGDRWTALTGHPMVFAVWAARRDAAQRDRRALGALTELLREANELFVRDPEPVIAAATARFPFSRGFIRQYLARLSYGFGDAERAGLAEFLARASQAGELGTVPRLAAA